MLFLDRDHAALKRLPRTRAHDGVRTVQPLSTSPDRPTIAVGFFDLAGYTTLTAVHGDDSAADVAERFCALVRGALTEGDELIKSIGDGVLVVSTSAAGLAALAHGVCAALDAEPAFPVLRVGLHLGPVVRRSGDVFGGTVNAAARVAALAAGGQVLASDALVAQLAGSYRTRPLGPVVLRGLPEPVVLHDLELCPAPHERLLDLVCGMALLPGAVIGQLRNEDGMVVFCSAGCLQQYLSSAPAQGS